MQVTEKIVKRYDKVLTRGLCTGMGSRTGQMCIEAAVCYALGLNHDDDPGCFYQLRLENYFLLTQKL